MKKKILISILCILFFIQVLYIGFNRYRIHKVNSIGIIGSADRPTSILLTNTSGYGGLIYCVVFFFIISAIVLLYLFKQRKSK